MPNNKEQFDEIAAQLKSELSLQTDEEFYRSALKESHDIYEHLQKEYQKGLDEIELTEHDLDLLDYIKGQLPHSFWALNDLSEDLYVNSSLASLQKYSHRFVDDFVKALCKGGWEGDVTTIKRHGLDEDDGDYVSFKDMSLEGVLVLFESLSKGWFWSDETKLMIIKIFECQPHKNKISIVKTLLSPDYNSAYDNSDWPLFCLVYFLKFWWDDALVPDIDRYWNDSYELRKECANVIALRFPLDYVLKHQKELERYNYYSVCCRLAKDKGFTIDKSRLHRYEYFSIFARNNIHIDDSEADRLLFDHIMKWVQPMHQHLKEKTTIDWGEFLMADSYQFKLKEILPYWFHYKPSLYELPDGKYPTLFVCSMGNTNTLAKLITWNQFLRSNIKSFNEEYAHEMLMVKQIPDALVEHVDKMWRRFVELAIETCPIEKASWEDEFHSSSGGYEDYIESELKEIKAENNMVRKKIELKNGHIVIGDGEGVVIDTGSPASFHQSGCIIIGDEPISVPQSYSGVTCEYLSEQIGCEINGLIGMDIINTHCVTISLKDELLFFNDDAEYVSFEEVKHNNEGLIIVGIMINNVYAKMIVDSGAKISYASNSIVEKGRYVCNADDFSPYFGKFDTPLYACQIDPLLNTMNEVSYEFNFGIPPKELSIVLEKNGVDGILGVDFFKRYRLQIKDGKMFFPPQGI